MNLSLRFTWLAGAVALTAFLQMTASAQAQYCDPTTSQSACINQPCDKLGETMLDADRSTVVACVAQTATIDATDCTGIAGGCYWQAPGTALVRVSIELVGAGGGGGSADTNGPGGNGASDLINHFDVMLHRGALLTVSVGSGGGGGIPQAWNLQYNLEGLLATVTAGGSGLYARGGEGGVGVDSGSGGGGGAGSVVMGDGFFAVAGGGGGGGGGAGDVAGLNGNQDLGGSIEAQWLPFWPKVVSGMDGAPGDYSCMSNTSYYNQDGGGGGGGGGGYPGGQGGFWGCDSYMYDHGSTTRPDGSTVQPGYSASGGQNGTSYTSSYYGTLAFSKGGNSAGVGGAGAGQSLSSSAEEGSQGQCGRVTIWSSTGQMFEFDCPQAGSPAAYSSMWIVQ